MAAARLGAAAAPRRVRKPGPRDRRPTRTWPGRCP